MSNLSRVHNRADKRPPREFADLGEKGHVASVKGNKYPLIVRDDFSRYERMYFISHMPDAPEAFERVWLI